FGCWFAADPFLIRPCLWCSLPLFQSVLVYRGRSSRRCAMAHKLFIGGLPFSTSNDRLREVFAQAGGVESATVVMELGAGRSLGAPRTPRFLRALVPLQLLLNEIASSIPR